MPYKPEKNLEKEKAKKDEDEKQISEIAKRLERVEKRVEGTGEEPAYQRKPAPRQPDVQKRNTLIYAGVAGLTIASLGVVGGMNYLSSLSRQSQQTSQTLQQQTQQTTPTTRSITTASITIDNPDTWPVRKTLSELRDSLKVPNSRSIYVLPEANIWEMQQSNNPMALLPKEASVEMRNEDYKRLYDLDELWYRYPDGRLMTISELTSYHPKFALFYDTAWGKLDLQHFFKDSRGIIYNDIHEEGISPWNVPIEMFQMWNPEFKTSPSHAIRFKGGYKNGVQYDKIFYEAEVKSKQT